MEQYANLVKLITDRCAENLIALPKIYLPVVLQDVRDITGIPVDLPYLEELAVKIITAQEANQDKDMYVNWPATLGFEDCEMLSGYIDHAIERSM